MATYYVSKTGNNGDALSLATAKTTVGAGLALLAAGDTLKINDGTYTGSGENIDPTNGLSGTSGSRITVSAINDGEVVIDGNAAVFPVLLNTNDYWTIEGINFTNSSGPVLYIFQSDNCIIRRCVGWTAAAGNNHTFSLDGCISTLVEDCAAFGRNRKCFEAVNSTSCTFRRCWFRNGAYESGSVGIEISYSASGTTIENCIGSWKNVGSGTGNAGIFGASGSASGTDDAKVLGCISYLLAADTASPDYGIFVGANQYNNVDFTDCVSYIEPGAHASILPWYLRNSVTPKTGCSAADITTIGDGTAPTLENQWTVTNHKNVDTVSDAYGSETLYDNDGTRGATIRYRYVDRVLTSDELWPWPMNQRIIDATTDAGLTAVDVDSIIQNIFGTYPSEEGEDAATVTGLPIYRFDLSYRGKYRDMDRRKRKAMYPTTQ